MSASPSDDDLDDTTGNTVRDDAVDGPVFGMIEALGAVFALRYRIAVGSVLIGLAALGATFLIKPTFTARTVFMPPQQSSSTLSALGSLGGLAGLATGSGALKSPGDQYVSFLQTRTVSDRIIARFDLLQAYDEEFRVEARKELAKLARFSAGKKDGLITIEVDDHDPAKAAEMANAYVEELRRVMSTLAVTEAQQRRVFFEGQLTRTRDALTKSQQELERSGFSPGALKAEPKAAAEGYAKLRAEIMAAEVRLQALRGSFADSTPEVQRQASALATMRNQLASMSSAEPESDQAGYISKYREFKYQETLFELFSRQYELARVDEAREGALIQVVEVADVPEKKSKPKRGLIAVAATLAGFLMLSLMAVSTRRRAAFAGDPEVQRRQSRWHAAIARR